MAAQEAVHAGVQEEAQEDHARVAEHHDEGHQRASAGNALIDRVAAEFSQQGFSRDDILLVLDNTETLASSPAKVTSARRTMREARRYEQMFLDLQYRIRSRQIVPEEQTT